MYIDKLNEIANKYHKKYHRTIKMKPVNVKDNTNIGFDKQIHNKDPKFKVGADVRISKWKNIFAKVFTSNWSEEFFVIKKIKNTLP